MTFDPNAMDPYSGLPFRIVRTMLDDASAAIARGEGRRVATEAEHQAFFDDIIARGRARYEARQSNIRKSRENTLRRPTSPENDGESP